MAIVRWNPIRQLAAMEVERLNRMFDDVWGRETDAGRFVPPVDIYENEARDIVLRVELPGMKREDIHITVEQNVLTISGERKYESEVPRDRFHRMERFSGSFSRSFSVPSTLDTEHIGAGYQDGILTVTLPQREEAKPRQIAIDVK